MSALLPPQLRTAHGAALQHGTAGELILPVCGTCGAVQYPPRELCGNCLSDNLVLRNVDCRGVVVAASTIQHSLEPYFAARLPWQLASVKLDCGPVVFTALRAQDNRPGQPVNVVLAHDPGGQWVLIAANIDINLRNAQQRGAVLQAIGYREMPQ
jgi:uncharacterized protein